MRFVDLGSISAREPKVKKKRRFLRPLVIGFVVILVLIAANTVRRKGFSALLDPVSIVTSFVGNSNLKETDGRTNVLILGLDKRGDSEYPGLTDTILVGSVGAGQKDVVMISLPRDLWVESGNGNYSKLNAVYELNGIAETEKVIEDVLGIPIHYYVVVDFNSFSKLIEILGGIEVNVDTGFDDPYYPVEGQEDNPDLNARYTRVHFDAGLQTMDANKALVFARSRKGNNGEGTDFARARRQQKVILAIRDKALSLETLANPLKIKELYDAYNAYVVANMGFGEIQAFYDVGRVVGFSNVRAIVLDDRSEEGNGGLLYAPEDTTLYGGAYVLIPRAGNYSQLHAYTLKFLFGDK